MKKSALLAVSALSLGVVGLSAFTPIVSAVDSASTTTAEVKVTIAEGLGIGNGGEDGQANGDFSATALNVDFGSKKPTETASVTKKIKTTNNSAHDATLNVKADSSNALKKGNDSIAYATATPDASHPGWDMQWDNVHQNLGTADSEVYTHSSGTPINQKDITFNLFVPAGTPSGEYKANVIYTFSQT